MAKKRYGKYIKKLSFKDEGPGFYRQIAKINGKSLGVNAQMEYGTYYYFCDSSLRRRENDILGDGFVSIKENIERRNGKNGKIRQVLC